MTQDTIERLALGNPINLGYLFNACTEKSCNVSILKEYPPPSEFITTTDIPNTITNFVHEKSFSDKLNKLNVAPELKLSLCAGIIDLSGSGEYFKETKESARSVSVSFVQRMTTKHENLRILEGNLRELIDQDALKCNGATHVVTGVTWGANLFVTADHKNNERVDEEVIACGLHAELKKLVMKLEKPKVMDLENRDTKTNSSFTVKIIGDVVAPDLLPTTIEGAMDLVATLPSLMQTYNNGKGVPICYEMTSLDTIQSYFGFNITIQSVLRALEEEVVLRMVMLFDEVNAVRQKLNDLCTDMERYEDQLPEKTKSEVKQLKQEAALAESKFKTKFKDLLVQVRSSNAEVATLYDLKEEYKSSPYSSNNVLSKLQNDCHAIMANVEFISTLQSLGVIIVPNYTQSLSYKLLQFKDKEVYVLYGESKAISQNPSQWDKHVAVFRRFIEDPNTAQDFRFMYVDLSAAPQLQPETNDGETRKILLQRFDKQGKCVDSDVLRTLMAKPEVKEQAEPRWVSCSNGLLPDNAVEGGLDGGETLYVARAWFKGALRPGKLYRSQDTVSVSWGRKEHHLADYEVLVAPPGTVRWVQSDSDFLVENAIVAGKAQNGETFYVGRYSHAGSTTPGKAHLSYKRCFIPYRNEEVAYETYEII